MEKKVVVHSFSFNRKHCMEDAAHWVCDVLGNEEIETNAITLYDSDDETINVPWPFDSEFLLQVMADYNAKRISFDGFCGSASIGVNLDLKTYEVIVSISKNCQMTEKEIIETMKSSMDSYRKTTRQKVLMSLVLLLIFLLGFYAGTCYLKSSLKNDPRNIGVPLAFEGDLSYDENYDRYELVYCIKGTGFKPGEDVSVNLHIVRESDGSTIAEFVGQFVADKSGDVIFEPRFWINGSEFDKGADTFKISGIIGGIPWNLSSIELSVDDTNDKHIWMPFGGAGGSARTVTNF